MAGCPPAGRSCANSRQSEETLGGSTASATTACSPAPPERLTLHSPVGCSRLHLNQPMTTSMSHPTIVRRAHAAADTWSSSRPSSVGGNTGPTNKAGPYPGDRAHDPTWPATAPSGNHRNAGYANAYIRRRLQSQTLQWCADESSAYGLANL
jgi:hypothetical protein